MTGFDALFFDMDGTLVQNGVLMPGAFQQGFRALGLPIEIEPWRGSGCTDWEVLEIYLSNFPEYSTEEKEALKEKIAPEVKRSVMESLRQQGLKALPGAAELIQKLKSLGITPGLLTGNMEDIVAPKLEAAGMSRSDFPYGGFGDHSPKRADAAGKALKSASAYFGREIAPERALIIGDTPNDIACARAVGAKVLAVPTGRFSREELLKYGPDYILNDLTEHEEFVNIIRC